MLKLIPFIVIIFTLINYAQNEELDKMETDNGQVYFGNVVKIKSDLVEFKDNETGLIYEYEKGEIRYILLANGEVLTFEEEFKQTQEESVIPPPVVIEKDSGDSVGLIILASVGAVLLVLLLIGAAAQ